MLTISTLRKSYTDLSATPSGVVAKLWEKIASWNDPAVFIHLPPMAELLEMAAAVEVMPRDLPLWGIPFVVKDNIDVAGWPTTAG